LTNAEIDVLNQYAGQIARNIQGGSMIVELGSGSVWSDVNMIPVANDYPAICERSVFS
jgi:uncharacterized SAM-dependent methyltransferase